jgi:hypothetical protein
MCCKQPVVVLVVPTESLRCEPLKDKSAMAIQLTIKNYRCFASPVTVKLSKGFTAFVGVNNAGKSAIMRFVVELRNLFGSFQSIDQLNQLLGQG